MANTPTTERAPRSRSISVKSMSADARREHMRQLAHKSHAGRLQLSSEERQKLVAAYRFLGEIAARHGLTDGEASDG